MGCLTFPNPVALIAAQAAYVVGVLELPVVRSDTAPVTCVVDGSSFFLCCAAVYGFGGHCTPLLDIVLVGVFRDP